MTVIPIRRDLDSAQLAKVEEVTPFRFFKVENDGDTKLATVVWNRREDTLYCQQHKEKDNCTHSARVRLSGILTHTVTRSVREGNK